MAAIQTSVLRDHLCWLWRVGSDSTHPGLSQAALLAEQVLRILGVEHASLDHMLCQVSTCLLPDATRVAAVMLEYVLLAPLLFDKQTHCQKKMQHLIKVSPYPAQLLPCAAQFEDTA